MRQFYILTALYFCTISLYAQTNTFPINGNVGIGTTFPNGRLDVNGDILLPGSNNNTTSRPAIGALRITGEISGYSANGINYDDGFLRLSAGGGTSPHVKSFIDLSGYSTLPDMRENITFGTGGMERMRIISSGYIGIGTSTPNYKVDIFKPGTGSALNIVGSAIGTRNDTGIDFSAINGTTVAYARLGLQIATGTLGQETGGLVFSTINGGVLSEKVFIKGDGNVGIGTTDPGSRKMKIVTTDANNDVGAEIEIVRTTGTNYGIIGKATGSGADTNIGLFTTAVGGISNQGLRIYNIGDATRNYAIYSDSPAQSFFLGNVGIGTETPREKLSVNGKIRAHEIKVETANWPDYVFSKSYNLPTLQETENHIKEKGHLPGIPSAAEVKANGIDLGEMNAKLLQKMEEMTLHLIKMDKRIQHLEFENQELKLNQKQSKQ